MHLRKTLTTTAAAAAALIAASTISAQADPSDGASLGECYTNWVSYCNEATSGYPNSCYGDNLDRCADVHRASMSTIPAHKLKSMKYHSMRKAKRSAATSLRYR